MCLQLDSPHPDQSLDVRFLFGNDLVDERLVRSIDRVPQAVEEQQRLVLKTCCHAQCFLLVLHSFGFGQILNMSQAQNHACRQAEQEIGSR